MERTCRTIISLLLGAAVLFTTLTVTAVPAGACEFFARFDVTATMFDDGRANLSDGEAATSFAAWAADHHWNNDFGDLGIGGVYIQETIATVEPVDEWTRGSVNVVTKYWGEAPELEPHSTGTFDHSTGEDQCGYLTDGPEFGAVSYQLLTDDIAVNETVQGMPSDQVLTATFGEPVVVPLDAGGVAALVRDLEQERGGSMLSPYGIGGSSPVPLFLGIGGVSLLLVLGSIVLQRAN